MSTNTFTPSNGVFHGRTMLQQTSNIGGLRYVFVKMQGIKNELAFPPIGCYLKNPFKGKAKLYAGDLVEYNGELNDDLGKAYVLKTYLVAENVAYNATTIYIVRDGYKHIPFVGDMLVNPTESLSANMPIATVTAVSKTTKTIGGKSVDVWQLTIDKAMGVILANDVLVEGKALASTDADVTLVKVAANAPATATTGDKYYNSTSKKVFTATATNTWGDTGTDPEAGVMYYDSDGEKFYMAVNPSDTGLVEVNAGTSVVQNPNMMLPWDMDFDFDPAGDDSGDNIDFDGARYQFTPCLGQICYQSKMSPLPLPVLALNSSRVNGWFDIR